MSQDPLFTLRDVRNHGATSDLVEAFRIRPIEVQVAAAGALGAMSVIWRFVGQENWSEPEPSAAGSSWSFDLPDPFYVEVTFTAATYDQGATWTVDPSGAVTAQEGAPSTLTAVRQDIIAKIIAGVTSDFVTRACSRCVPPIISIDEGQKSWCASVAVWRMKFRSGLTLGPDASADALAQREAEEALRNMDRLGASANRPPGVVDSSAGGTGTGIPLMPYSEPSRGF